MYKKIPCPNFNNNNSIGSYGCSHSHLYERIIPPNLLTPQQKQIVIDKVMNLPKVKLNPGWKLDSFDIYPQQDKWIGDIQLFLKGVKQPPPSEYCGWHGQVGIDLETLNILYIKGIPPRSDVKC